MDLQLIKCAGVIKMCNQVCFVASGTSTGASISCLTNSVNMRTFTCAGLLAIGNNVMRNKQVLPLMTLVTKSS